VVVSFPVVGDAETSLLAWTTTPWTLPSNLALCVNAGLDYVKVLDKKTSRRYWLAESRLSQLYKKKGGDEYQVLEKVKGAQLEGRSKFLNDGCQIFCDISFISCVTL
jgi:isoleucyl-tRNA synthetase